MQITTSNLRRRFVVEIFTGGRRPGRGNQGDRTRLLIPSAASEVTGTGAQACMQILHIDRWLSRGLSFHSPTATLRVVAWVNHWLGDRLTSLGGSSKLFTGAKHSPRPTSGTIKDAPSIQTPFRAKHGPEGVFALRTVHDARRPGPVPRPPQPCVHQLHIDNVVIRQSTLPKQSFVFEYFQASTPRPTGSFLRNAKDGRTAKKMVIES